MSSADIEGPEHTSALNQLPGPHQCPVCFKTYKRREHLLRHSSSHSSERRHRCSACNCAFQRADVLKRHLRTCQGTNGSPRATARRRACDRCAKQKKACNGYQPCSTCTKRDATCTYSTSPPAPKAPDTEPPPHQQVDTDGDLLLEPRVRRDSGQTMVQGLATPSMEDDGHYDNMDMAVDIFGTFSDQHLPGVSSPTWQGLLTFATDYQAVGETTSAAAAAANWNRRYRFDFLDRFTSEYGFVLSFDCGTLRQRQEVMSYVQCEMQACGPGHGIISNLGEVTNNVVLEGVSSNWLNDPLALKTHEILLLVKEVVTVKPRNSAVTLTWSPAMEQTCLQFFSPMNLRKFIEFYWAIWAPNVNFVHRPTFDAASSKSILVAAMALIG